MKLSVFVRYLPFFFLYVLMVLLLHDDAFSGDEERYYQFAQNLTNGFYSPSPPDINLWNGPGYPFFLVPFVYLGAPLILITLFNAIFQYLSVVLLYQSLKDYVFHKLATAITIFWGCYYISFQELGSMLTESFSLFIVTLFLYLFTQVKAERPLKFVIASGIVLGYLALTKIIFGYVILVMLALSLLQFSFKSKLQSKPIITRNFIGIFAIALLMNIPYLVYTYSLTGKLLYWGNSGGSSLYWMSTPYENEYGDWNNSTFTANCHNPNIPCNAYLLAKNHQKDMDYILSLPKIEQDDAYKDIAMQNIRTHPQKYLQNITSNVSRLFFGIPISYYPQQFSTVLRFPPNILLLSVMVLSLGLWLLYFNSIPIEVRYLIFLSLIYLGGTSLLSAYPRMLYVIVPIILFWCGCILDKCVISPLKSTQSPILQ